MNRSDLKIGDIVFAYTKGIHKVTNLIDGCSSGTCVKMQRILTSNYAKGSGKSTCDMSFIRKTSKEELRKLVEEFTKESLTNIDKYL